MDNNIKDINKEENVIKLLMFRYLPYWPLFLLLTIAFGAVAWTYLYFTNPVYPISANIMIKDEKKGVDNPEALQALDVYNSNSVVDNEIQVLESRELMNEVVKKLHLYAPVFKQIGLKTISAYTLSPIAIEVQNPDSLVEQDQVNFTFSNNKVNIAGQQYPLDTWLKTPYGILKFKLNQNLVAVDSTNSPYYFSLIQPAKVADAFISNLEIASSSKASSVLDITLNDEDPVRGVNVLNELIDRYSNIAIDEKKALAANTLTFVENRINHLVRELDSIEGRVQKFRSNKGVINLDEQGKLFLQNVGDNDKKLADIETKLAVLDQIEKYVVSKDNEAGIVPSTLGVDDPVLSQLLQSLYDAEMQYEKSKKTVAAGNPIMLSLKNEIETTRPRILENIQNQRATLIASKNNISATNGMYGSVLQTIPEKERELIEVSRQLAIKNDVYAFLLHKREETALSYAAAVSESRIINRAEASTKPVSPKKPLFYLGAFALAFTFGIGWIGGRELLGNKILFRSEIEELTNIPVAAEITTAPKKQYLVVNDSKYIVIAEQFRQLRAAIGLYGKKSKKKRVLVTSSISGEGKSFISCNLALSLALSGKKVVLIDMDLRSPVVSKVFGLNERKGVAEFLEDDLEPYSIICNTEHNNLFVVPGGNATINPTELFLNKSISGLMDYLESSFDFIIIDAAPIDPVTDAYVLSEYCTDTLYVMRHNYTPKATVQTLNVNNTFKALKNVAIVFNGVKPRGFVKKDYGFGYGYGYNKVYGKKAYGIKK